MLSADVLPYLRGERFDEQLRVGLGSREPVEHRLEIVSRLVAGKNVVHVGFVDHLDVIDRKIASGDWFHDRLCHVSKRCLGVDINAAGVAYVRDRYGISDVVCADLAGPETVRAIRETHWEYFVLAEVLEHIDSPVDFLKSIRERYGGCFDALILTVPNAFCGGNVIAALRRREIINSDHRYWFTPYTLAKVATMAGYRVSALRFASYSHNAPLKQLVKDAVLRRAPMLAERLVLVCEAGGAPQRAAGPREATSGS